MRLRSLLLAALVVLTGAAGLTASPGASAASGYCTGAGVNVLVDFTGQGGGIARGCATHGAGGNAWDAFQAAGFPLTSVQRYPGAVCRVSGRPADVSCQGMPPADAYWGFFTSHGAGWSYASVGPSSYRVADGDTVAFAWQSGAKRQPAAAPAPARPRSTPTPSRNPSPTPAPSRHSGGGHPHTTAPVTSAPVAPAARGGSARATGRATPHPRARATAGTPARTAARHHRAAAARPSGTPTPTATATATATDGVAAAPVSAPASQAPADHGLPWWVPVLVLVALGGAGGALAWRRRTALR